MMAKNYERSIKTNISVNFRFLAHKFCYGLKIGNFSHFSIGSMVHLWAWVIAFRLKGTLELILTQPPHLREEETGQDLMADAEYQASLWVVMHSGQEISLTLGLSFSLPL
jgi:hypothetical protein